MAFRHFRLICVAKVVVLAITLGLFLYLILEGTKYATAFLVGLVIVYQVCALIAFVETTNRDLKRFLESIEYSDFSQSFPSRLRGSSFEELSTAFSNVIARFQETRLEKEESLRYLQTVVQHFPAGIIAFDETGRIELINAAAKRLFDTAPLRRIDDLAIVSEPLVQRIQDLGPGQRDLVTVLLRGELLQLSLAATQLRLRQKKLTLVTLQNIASELNQKEIESWQNLIRVLTHEIRNSLTPIASLAATARQLVAPAETTSDNLNIENLADIQAALEIIQKRANGLNDFVDAYGKLTRIPGPNFRPFPIAELFERLEKLIGPQLVGNRVSFESLIESEDLRVTADSQLIEQVLINLVLNAIDALAETTNPRVRISACINNHGRTLISVTDNGPGIVADVVEKLFVPFFTTKKGGSGIGLSLSRQIMHLHRGELTVQSVPNKETQFTLLF